MAKTGLRSAIAAPISAGVTMVSGNPALGEMAGSVASDQIMKRSGADKKLDNKIGGLGWKSSGGNLITDDGNLSRPALFFKGSEMEDIQGRSFKSSGDYKKIQGRSVTGKHFNRSKMMSGNGFKSSGNGLYDDGIDPKSAIDKTQYMATEVNGHIIPGQFRQDERDERPSLYMSDNKFLNTPHVVTVKGGSFLL